MKYSEIKGTELEQVINEAGMCVYEDAGVDDEDLIDEGCDAQGLLEAMRASTK